MYVYWKLKPNEVLKMSDSTVNVPVNNTIPIPINNNPLILSIHISLFLINEVNVSILSIANADIKNGIAKPA
jgi:hypothetical protein